MANQLKMADIQAILSLKELGWSNRRIAKKLGIHRETVAGYVNRAQADSKPANLPTGSSGPRSLCEPFREFILEEVDQGLSAQRIWQDLRVEHNFEGGYDSVKRYTRNLRSSHELPFRRMECEPGEEVQVDFGSGYFVVDSKGKRRLTHFLRVILSHSRKGYTEAVFKQSTENFIRCLENAFLHFGGTTRVAVIDNLLAAVSKADWYDPELNPKVRKFANYYDVAILPTLPYTPRHKGKVERGVAYVKSNALKGRVFKNLAELNNHLLDWERSVADTRIHGTTRKQVGKIFEEVERPALKPLPLARFPFFHEAERTVHRDGHIELGKAYYSAPPEYLRRKVWARWDSRVVRIFNQRMEQVAIHVKVEPGRFSTLDQHIADEKISGVEKGAAYFLTKASRIGPQTARWSEQMIKHRGIQGVRVLMGLLNISNHHSSDQIERACEVACSNRAFNLRTIRELIKRQAARQEQFEFMDEHPIIRSMSEYEELVREVLRGSETRKRL